MTEIQPSRKLGLIGWALSGGVYFGNIPGSKIGSVGIACLVAGAFKTWIAMHNSHDTEIKSRLLLLFLFLGLGGVGLLAYGYYQYLTQDTTAPPSTNTKGTSQPDESIEPKE